MPITVIPNPTTAEATDRLEIEGPDGPDLQILSYRARAFAPRAEILDQVLDRWPVAA